MFDQSTERMQVSRPKSISAALDFPVIPSQCQSHHLTGTVPLPCDNSSITSRRRFHTTHHTRDSGEKTSQQQTSSSSSSSSSSSEEPSGSPMNTAVAILTVLVGAFSAWTGYRVYTLEDRLARQQQYFQVFSSLLKQFTSDEMSNAIEMLIHLSEHDEFFAEKWVTAMLYDKPIIINGVVCSAEDVDRARHRLKAFFRTFKMYYERGFVDKRKFTDEAVVTSFPSRSQMRMFLRTCEYLEQAKCVCLPPLRDWDSQSQREFIFIRDEFNVADDVPAALKAERRRRLNELRRVVETNRLDVAMTKRLRSGNAPLRVKSRTRFNGTGGITDDTAVLEVYSIPLHPPAQDVQAEQASTSE
jgi:hypothetical protein